MTSTIKESAEGLAAWFRSTPEIDTRDITLSSGTGRYDDEYDDALDDLGLFLMSEVPL